MQLSVWQLFLGAHLGKLMHSLAVHVTGWVLPSVLLSPTRSNHRRIPLAQCCSPLAPEAACLCHSVFALLCKTCAGRHTVQQVCSHSYSIGSGLTDRCCWLGPQQLICSCCALSLDSTYSLRYLNCLLWKLKVTP